MKSPVFFSERRVACFLRDRLVYSLSSFLLCVKITTLPSLLFAAELELSSQSNIDFSEQSKSHWKEEMG